MAKIVPTSIGLAAKFKMRNKSWKIAQHAQ